MQKLDARRQAEKGSKQGEVGRPKLAGSLLPYISLFKGIIGDCGAVEKVGYGAILVIPTEAKRNGGIP